MWLDLGALDGDKSQWQLSQSFEGNLIRIDSTVSSPTLNIYNHRGLIAINYDFKYFLDTRVFFSEPKSQLFLFPEVEINLPKFLAVKSITSRSNNNQWTVRAKVWNQIIPSTINLESVNLSSESLNEIQDLIDNSVQTINQNTTIINENTTQILSLMTGGI